MSRKIGMEDEAILKILEEKADLKEYIEKLHKEVDLYRYRAFELFEENERLKAEAKLPKSYTSNTTWVAIRKLEDRIFKLEQRDDGK